MYLLIYLPTYYLTIYPPALRSCVDVLPVLVSCAMVAKCSQNAAKMHAKCWEKQAFSQNWPPLSSEKQKWKILMPSCATCLDQQAKCKEKVHPNMPHQSQHTPNWPPLSSEKQKWENMENIDAFLWGRCFLELATTLQREAKIKEKGFLNDLERSPSTKKWKSRYQCGLALHLCKKHEAQ